MRSSRLRRPTILLVLLQSVLFLPTARADEGPQPGRPENGGTVRVLVAYYSVTGTTEQMARLAKRLKTR
jgi:hypothetical protein